MAEIINLRRTRKAKQRAAKDAEAAQNRARSGAPKSERNVTKARSEKAAHDLAGHRLDPDKSLEK